MWPFKKSGSSLKDSGLFDGFTDWHSHILPGVDDGIKTIEESIEVLNAYQELGFKKVWLTPHIMEDYPNETVFLKEKFKELQDHWKGSLEIKLASENMLDSLFEERLENNDFLPIGDEGKYLLVETSYYTPPYGMEEMLEKIRKKGFFPILAHPERYRYMEKEDYKKLRNKGLKFQLNFLSLVGGYGEGAQKKSEWLLENDMIDMLGSDIHRLESVMHSINLSPNKSSIHNKIMQLNRSKIF